MRRLAAFVVLAISACGPEETPFSVTAVTPAEVPAGLGGELAISGTALERTSGVAAIFGMDRIELEWTLAGAEVRATVPAGTRAGRYDLELSPKDGAAARVEGAFAVLDGELQIEVANVGQGDGAYVRAPNGRVLLIDGGRARTANDSIRPLLVERGVRPDFVLVTHFDADHLGGVVDYLRGDDGEPCTADDRAPTLGLIDYTREQNTCASDLCVDYYRLRECLGPKIASGTGWVVPGPGATIPLGGGVKATVVAVNGRVDGAVVPTGSDNSNSIALLIEYGSFRYLTAGDLTGGESSGCNVGSDTADVETALAPRVGAVDVLHVNHHGSCTSSNVRFVETLAPAAALISVGENNAYGHPAQAVLDRLDAAGARVFLTTPGMTTETGPFERTRLPASAEPRSGHLRVRTADGRRYQVEVLDATGRVQVSRDFQVPAR